MAFKTQIRLAQLSGSFGNAEGKIRDDSLVRTSLSAIPATDLSGSLSQLASSIRRINGGDAFSAVAASTLKDAGGTTRIDYVDSGPVNIRDESGNIAVGIGGANATDKTATFAGNVVIPDGGTIGNASLADSITILGTSGNVQIKAAKDLLVDEILESTSANGVVIDGVKLKDNDILFPGDASTIGSNSTADLLTLNANDLQVKATKSLKVDIIAESGAAAGVTIDGVLVKDNDIKFPADASTIGSDTTVDLVTFNADDLQIKGTKSLLVDTIGESTSAAGVTIDGVLIKDNNITVPGNLTVNGTTTTLDVANLNVEDPFILLGDGAQSQNSNSGLIFVSGSSRSNGTRPDVTFARVDADTWGLGSITSNSGSITDATGMTHDISLRLSRLELESANDRIVLDTDVKVISAADIVLDPAGNDVKVDGNVVPNADDGGTLGSANLNWADLFLADAAVANFGDNQDVTLTHVHNTGLLLNSTRQIQFNDSDEAISSDGSKLVLRSAGNDFSLPTGTSTGNQVMVFASDGTATFSNFNAVSAEARNQVIKTTAQAPVVSGSILSEQDGVLNIVLDASITDSSLDSGLQAFVNGQLLMSGTVAEVGTQDADYHLVEDGVAPDATITFDGTTGDVSGNYNNGAEATFELLFLKPLGQKTQVQDASSNVLTVASNVSAGGSAIGMSANPSGLVPGTVISYINTSGNRIAHRLNNTGGANLNINGTTVGTIAAGTKIDVIGESQSFEFDVTNGTQVTGTDSGGKIQIGIGGSGTALNPALGSAGAAEKVAEQVAEAINKAAVTAPHLKAEASGLVVTVESNAFFGAGANGIALVNNIQNTNNNPFAGANYANGADSGRKSIVFGFDLEEDDTVQIHIR